MHPVVPMPSTHRRATILVVAVLAVAIGLATERTAMAQDAPDPKPIQVQVRLDPSQTGPERCVVDPEDLFIPVGVSAVTWSLEVSRDAEGSGGSAMGLAGVELAPSLPVTANDRVDQRQWRAVFDCQEPFAKTEYDIFVQEADGTVTECYPHVAGSADQSGGGGG